VLIVFAFVVALAGFIFVTLGATMAGVDNGGAFMFGAAYIMLCILHFITNLVVEQQFNSRPK